MNMTEANQALTAFDKNLMLWGAFGFGLIIGWFVYYLNRYRKGDVQFSDITTILGAVGGSAIVSLFGQGTGMFGAYGIGLAVGFFGYFLTLVILVNISPNFGVDWFLDGRRKNPAADEGYGTTERPPMALRDSDGLYGNNPGGPARALVSGQTPALAPPDADANAQKVIKACKDTWPGSKGSCNGFVQDAAAELGVALSGTADEILAAITATGSGWTKVANGVAAKAAAEKGKLVVAGLDSASLGDAHGHVVIVVAGAMNPGGWAPAAYWGSLNATIAAKGGDGSPLSLCFTAAAGAHAKFVYRSYDW